MAENQRDQNHGQGNQGQQGGHQGQGSGNQSDRERTAGREQEGSQGTGQRDKQQGDQFNKGPQRDEPGHGPGGNRQ